MQNIKKSRLEKAMIRLWKAMNKNPYFKAVRKNWMIYLMLIPGLVFLALFRYLPINGILVAFKYFDYGDGIMKSDFRGFVYIKDLMFGNNTRSVEFWRAFRNTFSISMYGLIFGFPVPIILALFFSEIKNGVYRSITQILTYLPKFISTVVITTLMTLMLYGGKNEQGPGILADLFINLGLIKPGTAMLYQAKYFRSIYTVSGIWEGAGYGSIVYFAAIMAISPTNYEAAKIDGASKLAQIRYVTLPGMAPTLVIMLILRIGEILTVGYEKIMLLYVADTYQTADVISTYVLRLGGIISGGTGSGTDNLSYAGAADLFNSLISMCLVLGANFISRRVSDTSLF